MKKPGELSAMISSTVWDLPAHREQVRDACLSEGIFPTGMEHCPAQDANGIQVSLEMVDQSDIYIGIYAWRYGWVPDFDNCGKISITEMEFNRALECKAGGNLKEILIFIMDDAHPIVASDKEDGDQAQEKLRKFKLRASEKRNVRKFKSREELKTQIIHALAHFKEARAGNTHITAPAPAKASTPIPKPPAFYAEPDYIGSHTFVGRDAELQLLSDWALPADPTNLLLFEAIGGNGKSMLTWQWTKYYSTAVRRDWAGRFWYSFYEKGAIMADFCQRALAYMTGQLPEELRKKKTAELKEPLLAQLHAKPWLLILDGLERVLVAYHRIDAAEVPDEEVNAPTDKIVNRNPRDAIRDEENDLLRALAAAAPSKILVSSRLTPRVLLNPSSQPITGAKRITLPGLRPPDAEKLLRSCGIEGDSAAIQSYLTANCDNHPLVIGVLGGLINHYCENRGNFDAWVADPHAGGALDLASLDLIQRRNHILRAALDALPPESRQLLSTLALLTDSVDYETLKAFNPHLPPEPAEVQKPTPLEKQQDLVDDKNVSWALMSDQQKAERQKQYDVALVHWRDYETAVQARLASAAFLAAPKKLEATVTDLEQRGLLQWDGRERKYNLHPVVRGVAAGGMAAADRERHGQRVVDHFSAQPHRPYDEAETMEDVRSGVHVVRTLLKLGHFQQAADAYTIGLAQALVFNLEAHAERLSLLRPFFPTGWGELPKHVRPWQAGALANDAAIALRRSGETSAALVAYGASLQADLAAKDWEGMGVSLRNTSNNLTADNRLARALRVSGLALEIATLREDQPSVFISRVHLFAIQSQLGQWTEATATWQLLRRMGGDWSRSTYRPGNAEEAYAWFLFYQGILQEDLLAQAERLATEAKNRATIRDLHRLRGDWRLQQGEWTQATASYQEAVRLARERNLPDADSETGLALAKYHLGKLAEPRLEAQRLAQLRDPAHRLLAQLWIALSEPAKAGPHALAAYKWAWADGEPYVHRYELTKTTELLQQMQIAIPNLPYYDPDKDESLPWEFDVVDAIEKLRGRAEKEGEDAEES
jgi:tetratricopeptide (TPR) repeat protein